MEKNAVILGYSGHAYVVSEILMSNGYRLVGYCDATEKADNPFKLKYMGSELYESIQNVISSYSVFIGIGNNSVRAAVYKNLSSKGFDFPKVIHPKAIVSVTATMGQASVVMPGAVINTMTKIGHAVICNSSCVIEHECFIDNYVHIAPGAVLAGNVSVGEGSFIGANAVIKQGVTIGSNVIIGAGAVVINDVADDLTIYGNPAMCKMQNP